MHLAVLIQLIYFITKNFINWICSVSFVTGYKLIESDVRWWSVLIQYTRCIYHSLNPVQFDQNLLDLYSQHVNDRLPFLLLLVPCDTVPEKYSISHSNFADVSTEAHRYGDTVTLSCNSGYVLSTGSPYHTIQCQTDGSWGLKDAVPHCKRGKITWITWSRLMELLKKIGWLGFRY